MNQVTVDPMSVIAELRDMLAETSLQLAMARAHIANLERQSETQGDSSDTTD